MTQHCDECSQNVLLTSKMKMMINVFLWSVLAHLHPVSVNKFRVSNHKPYEHELDVTGISFSTKVQEVKNNKEEQSIH